MTLLGNAYKVSRRIAVSDLAEVLLAAQHGFGGLEKLVVVKRVLPHLRADPHFVRIFVEEARAATALKHQHVAETYDVVHDEHDLCLVTEYLSGEDLSFLTRSYGKGELKMPVPIACRVIAQVASGLHYAHSRKGMDGRPEGMLHRDISPGNVIVTYNGVTKLTDFGIAHADVQNIYARPATVKMKLAYRSPERIQHKELDERSDVYSLGVLLYEMLVGRRLFRGENEAGVLKNVMELKVPPPSQLNPDISPQLDDLVIRTIERDPATRTPTAEDLRQGLEAVLAKSKQFVSEHEVHVWLTSSLKSRYTERQRMERSVVAEARSISRRAAATAELPPMFGGFSGSEVTVTPSATSVSTMVGRAGTAQMPLYGADTQRRSRTLLLSLVASLVTLIIVLTFAFAYWLGRRSPTEVGVVTAPSVNQADSPEVVSSPAALLVHASPEGASLEIDGTTMAGEVGAEGVLIPVTPNKTVTVTLRMAGYPSESLQVQAPSGGTKQIYVRLSAGDAGASSADAASASGTGTAAARPQGPPSVESGVPSRRSGRRPGQARSRAAEPVAPGRPVVARRRPSSGGKPVSSPRPLVGQRGSKSATLEVTFSPPNATLVVDGSRREGRSPVRVEGLAPGQHRVSVSAPGFETQTRQVELQPGEANGTVTIRLPSPVQSSPVSVSSTPAGALVRIDGKLRGKSPLRGLWLPAGRTYRIEVLMPGYQVWRTRLKIESDTASSIEATLVK